MSVEKSGYPFVVLVVQRVFYVSSLLMEPSAFDFEPLLASLFVARAALQTADSLKPCLLSYNTQASCFEAILLYVDSVPSEDSQTYFCQIESLCFARV